MAKNHTLAVTGPLRRAPCDDLEAARADAGAVPRRHFAGDRMNRASATGASRVDRDPDSIVGAAEGPIHSIYVEFGSLRTKMAILHSYPVTAPARSVLASHNHSIAFEGLPRLFAAALAGLQLRHNRLHNRRQLGVLDLNVMKSCVRFNPYVRRAIPQTPNQFVPRIWLI